MKALGAREQTLVNNYLKLRSSDDRFSQATIVGGVACKLNTAAEFRHYGPEITDIDLYFEHIPLALQAEVENTFLVASASRHYGHYGIVEKIKYTNLPLAKWKFGDGEIDIFTRKVAEIALPENHSKIYEYSTGITQVLKPGILLVTIFQRTAACERRMKRARGIIATLRQGYDEAVYDFRRTLVHNRLERADFIKTENLARNMYTKRDTRVPKFFDDVFYSASTRITTF